MQVILEHKAVDLNYDSLTDRDIALSQAISLKRIADFLDEELRYNPEAANLFDRLTGG